MLRLARSIAAGSLLALMVGSALAAGIDQVCPPRGARCGDYDALARAIDQDVLPVPDGQPGPLVMPAGGWSQFGRAQPATPVWNPPGPKRVGLQAGHYRFDEAPPELLSLRRNPGAPGGGRVEWQVTIDLAERAAEILRAQRRRGRRPADDHPGALPRPRLPGDARRRRRDRAACAATRSRGRTSRASPRSTTPSPQTIYDEYGRATGLPDNSEYITGRMRNYYAFNARRYQHAVAPGVPQAIIETGFMSNATDRDFLFNRPEVAAQGIADAVLRFLAADIY